MINFYQKEFWTFSQTALGGAWIRVVPADRQLCLQTYRQTALFTDKQLCSQTDRQTDRQTAVFCQRTSDPERASALRSHIYAVDVASDFESNLGLDVDFLPTTSILLSLNEKSAKHKI